MTSSVTNNKETEDTNTNHLHKTTEAEMQDSKVLQNLTGIIKLHETRSSSVAVNTVSDRELFATINLIYL